MVSGELKLVKSNKLILQFQIIPEEIAVSHRGDWANLQGKMSTCNKSIPCWFIFFIKAGEKWQDMSHIHRSLTRKVKMQLLPRRKCSTEYQWEWNLSEEGQLYGTL